MYVLQEPISAYDCGEDLLNTNHNCKQKSAIMEHQINTNLHMCIDQAKVIAIVDHSTKRLVREVIEIEKFRNNLNREDG
jgi:phage anti-repressor protein